MEALGRLFCAVFIACCWLAPSHVFAWLYIATFAILVALRVLFFVSKGYMWFMTDLCYGVHIWIIALFLWPAQLEGLIVNQQVTAWVTWYLSIGWCGCGVILWGNSLDFSSLDRLTSVFLHASPTLVLHNQLYFSGAYGWTGNMPELLRAVAVMYVAMFVSIVFAVTSFNLLVGADRCMVFLVYSIAQLLLIRIVTLLLHTEFPPPRSAFGYMLRKHRPDLQQSPLWATSFYLLGQYAYLLSVTAVSVVVHHSACSASGFIIILVICAWNSDRKHKKSGQARQ